MKRFIAIKKKGADKVFIFREGTGMSIFETLRGRLNLHGLLIHKGEQRPVILGIKIEEWERIALQITDSGHAKWLEAGVMLAEKMSIYRPSKEDSRNTRRTAGPLTEQMNLVWARFPSWQTPEFKKKNKQAYLPLVAAANSLIPEWPRASAQLVGRHLKSLGLSLDW